MSSIPLNSEASALQQLKTINLMAQSAKLCTSGNIGLINGRVVKFNTHWEERRNLQVTEEMRTACDSLRKTLKELVHRALAGQDAAIRKICAAIDGGADKPLLERSVVVKVIRDVEGHLKKAESLRHADKDLAAYSSSRKDTTFSVQRRLAQNARVFDLDNQLDCLPPDKRREALLECVDMCASLVGDTFVPSDAARRKFDDMVRDYTKALNSFPEDHLFECRDVDNAQKTLGVFARVVNGGKSLSLSEADRDLRVLSNVADSANEARGLTEMGGKYPRLVAQLSALLSKSCLVSLNSMSPQELALRESDKDHPFTPAELYRRIGAEMPKYWTFNNTCDFGMFIAVNLPNKPWIRESPAEAPHAPPSPDNARAEGQICTINSLTGNLAIDFGSLRNVSSGKYNVGEIVAQTGGNGITFDKINNHVTRTGSNDVIRTEEENRQTNAAVFKAILSTYGGVPRQTIDRFLDKDLDSIKDDAFNDFSNPYVKEAFHFLLADELKGKPLSRDEMRLLIQLLDDARGNPGVQPQAGMQRLRNLHRLKTVGLVDEKTRSALADVKGYDVENARVRAKNALEVTKNQWAADSGMAPREKAAWQTGVPMLETGVVLQQSSLMNTCFLCSVLNGIARSKALRAHFASLVDRRQNPPTIRLFTPTACKLFRLDETFGLDDKMRTRIAQLKATDFERFFMRYLSRYDPDYKAGDYGNDMAVAHALGLVLTSQGQLSDRGVTWTKLVDHLQKGGLVTLNRTSTFSQHYTSVVSADANGCRIADSISGTISYLTKEQAMALWDESITLSFFSLPSQENLDRFKQHAQHITRNGFLSFVDVEIERESTRKNNSAVDELTAIRERLATEEGYFQKVLDGFIEDHLSDGPSRRELHCELPVESYKVDSFCVQRLLRYVKDLARNDSQA